MIFAAASLWNPKFTQHQWQIFLTTCLLLILNAVVCSRCAGSLAVVSQIGAFLNFITLLIFCITILVVNTTEFNATSDVWGTITNGTEWPDGFAILMSFFGVIWTLSGYDAPVHLSEQCLNAKKAAPKAIITTSVYGALLGFFAVLAIAYSITDVEAVVGPDVDQPMVSFVVQVLGKKTGLALFSLIIACCVFEGQACMIISSRLVYACSRDHILPGWQILENNGIQTLVSASILQIEISINISLDRLLYRNTA